MTRCSGLPVVLIVLAGSVASAQDKAAVPEKPSVEGSYLVRATRFHADPEVLRPGFLTGLRGFESFAEPVGNPIYFESPFNTSGLRFLYLHHGFPDDSVLGGGDLNVIAMQARVALTERLAFIATKDGYSRLDADALPSEEGWNALAAGLKYTVYADREADAAVAVGARYQLDSGEAKVLQNGVGELSPFVSFAKGWDRLHLIGAATVRIPDDSDDGNTIVQWDLHLDWELDPEVLKGLHPLVELHGLHYTSDGERTPLPIGGADYSNLGSTDVSGSTVVWAGAGFRWKFTPNFSAGATYEYPLTNRDADIFGDRVTIDFRIDW